MRGVVEMRCPGLSDRLEIMLTRTARNRTECVEVRPYSAVWPSATGSLDRGELRLQGLWESDPHETKQPFGRANAVSLQRGHLPGSVGITIEHALASASL